MDTTAAVLAMIRTERERQNRLWNRFPGEWTATDPEKLVVLVEEVGEVARAVHDQEGPVRLLEELVQVAAVATAWAETLVEEVAGREPEGRPYCARCHEEVENPIRLGTGDTWFPPGPFDWRSFPEIKCACRRTFESLGTVKGNPA